MQGGRSAGLSSVPGARSTWCSTRCRPTLRQSQTVENDAHLFDVVITAPAFVDEVFVGLEPGFEGFGADAIEAGQFCRGVRLNLCLHLS